jgi:lipopolysaccharide biosynthesis glycosyltransferase
MPNGGLQVVNPSNAVYELILSALADPKTMNYEFADQSLLSDVFPGRWVALPYIYNALKTLRWSDVHAPIWRDDEVKNLHYILSPKPWENPKETQTEDTMKWWWDINAERVKKEKEQGIIDEFQD